MAYRGNPGVSALAGAMSGRMKAELPTSLVLDFGSIGDDGSLQTNTYPIPIPRSDYTVCRTVGGLELEADGGQHGGHESGDGAHRHQAKAPAIRAGDRVLVAWVLNEPVVVDVIMPAAAG